MDAPLIFDGVNWNADFLDSDRGIKLEYPIISNKINEKTNYFGMSVGWTEYPNLERVVESNRNIACIIDLVILSNGKPKYGLEVVHKHSCSPKKIRILTDLSKQYGFAVYEISSLWILDQIKRPSSLCLSECIKN